MTNRAGPSTDKCAEPPFGAAVVLLGRPSLRCTDVVDLASRQDPGAGCAGAHPAGVTRTALSSGWRIGSVG